ncbi:maleylacetoacetate isomerase [Sphingomonas arenae]|uniref:maleylacetoacetate isomerase n=1 Tax=Sphingomonas arenae TaxID=2812555 RepID=UPI0019688BB8|nr:maleylacetoacetate isomerase [Sphingomonas arenae]
MSRPVLHDYFRSSAAYRVRIALNLKGVEHERRPVNLLEGAQRSPEYHALNPQGLVPMLEIDGHRLTQSLSIIVYLDQRFPEPPLVPRDPADGAHVRSLALAIACDIHPLNNLRVLSYLRHEMDQSQEARDSWYRHWVIEGLTALEAMASPRASRFLFGDEPSLADVCLVPQMFNARRFHVPLEPYPTLVRADEAAQKLPAFAAAHPDRIAEELGL